MGDGHVQVKGGKQGFQVHGAYSQTSLPSPLSHTTPDGYLLHFCFIHLCIYFDLQNVSLYPQKMQPIH